MNKMSNLEDDYMDKVLFLDIDGVLNSAYFFKNRQNKESDLDINAVKILENIVEKTNCAVVLSSSWRMFGLEYVNEEFLKIKSRLEIDYYTTTKHMDRGLQIKQFIEENNIDNYVVVDDEICDIKQHLDSSRVVKTEFRGDGLNHEIADKIIELLNK